jgi:hypothetical protein
VTDIDAAVASAVRHGAVRRIATFPDPIGRDPVIQWPGGVNMQIYWHTAKPNYAPLATVPENRIYLTSDASDSFIRDWTGFAHGRIVSDDRSARARKSASLTRRSAGSQSIAAMARWSCSSPMASFPGPMAAT